MGIVKEDHLAYRKIIEAHERLNHYTRQNDKEVKNYSAIENRFLNA